MWSSCESPVKGKLTETSLHILSDTLGHAPCSGQRFCSRFCVKCRTRGKGRSWPRRRGAEQRNAGVLPRPNTPSRALAPPGCRRRKVLPMCPVRSVTCVSGRSPENQRGACPVHVNRAGIVVTVHSGVNRTSAVDSRPKQGCWDSLPATNRAAAATRLSKNVKLQERVAELQATSAELATVTRQRMLERLKEDVDQRGPA